jgi:biotin carboxylase
MGYKTAARNIAKQVGVPIIPWTEFPLKDKQEALEWC